MSIHNEVSFQKARRNGAMAAYSRTRWSALTSLTKRELAELLVHALSLSSESYDQTITDDNLFLQILSENLRALRIQGIV